MPGLVPGIHASTAAHRQHFVDGRVKPGHDGNAGCGKSGIGYAFVAPASQVSQQARAKARTRPI